MPARYGTMNKRDILNRVVLFSVPPGVPYGAGVPVRWFLVRMNTVGQSCQKNHKMGNPSANAILGKAE